MYQYFLNSLEGNDQAQLQDSGKLSPGKPHVSSSAPPASPGSTGWYCSSAVPNYSQRLDFGNQHGTRPPRKRLGGSSSSQARLFYSLTKSGRGCVDPVRIPCGACLLRE